MPMPFHDDPAKRSVHNATKIEEPADVKEVRAIEDETAAGCDQASMRTVQLP
jgi:hypothetical protein